MTANQFVKKSTKQPMKQSMNQPSDKSADSQSTQNLEDKLKNTLDDAKFPNANTVVTGALNKAKIDAIAEAGIEHVINLQVADELDFDEQSAVEAQGMIYTHLPIADEKDLKQLNLLKLDQVLRQYHGKKTLLHCQTGGRVGACMALRAGWLRGRKMDTAMQRGRDHGLTDELEEEVRNRLLVPR